MANLVNIGGRKFANGKLAQSISVIYAALLRLSAAFSAGILHTLGDISLWNYRCSLRPA